VLKTGIQRALKILELADFFAFAIYSLPNEDRRKWS